MLARVPPSDVLWQVGDAPGDLFGDEAGLPAAEAAAFSVPRLFIDLARTAICHADPERFALLYALLVRLRADPGAMADAADPLLRRLEAMAKDDA